MHGNNKFGLASLMNLDKLPPKGAVLITPPLKIARGLNALWNKGGIQYAPPVR